MEKLLVWIFIGMKGKTVKVKVFSTFESAKKCKQFHGKDFDIAKILQSEVE